MNEPMRDDPERDAWLRAALANAPDADVGAPAALSAAILRAAAARGAPAPRRGQWLLDAWDWLARPPVAAALASVMVAGVVGLMWWDRPMDEAMPRSPIPATPAAAPALVEKLAPAQGSAMASAAAASPADAPTTAPPAAARITLPPAPKPSGDIVRARVPPPPSNPAEARARPPVQLPAGPGDAAPAPAQATAPAAPAAVAEAPTANDERATQRRAERASADRATAPQAPAPALADAARQASTSAAASQQVDAAPANLALGLQAMGKSRPLPSSPTVGDVASPIGALLLRWPATPGEWRWQPPGGTDTNPADTAAQAWLQKVERATLGRWQPQPAPRESGPAARWWRGDALLGTLHFEAQGLAWRGADGRTAFAPLDAATLAALRTF